MALYSATTGRELSPEQIIGAGRVAIATKTPYFRHVLVGTVLRMAPALGTFAMSNTGIMLADPQYVVTLTVDECAGVMVHEMLHLMMKHWMRVPTVSWMSASRVRALWNVACDIAINPMVIAMGFKLPAGVLMPATYGMPEGKSAEEYFAILLKKEEDKRAEQQKKEQEQEKQAQRKQEQEQGEDDGEQGDDGEDEQEGGDEDGDGEGQGSGNKGKDSGKGNGSDASDEQGDDGEPGEGGAGGAAADDASDEAQGSGKPRADVGKGSCGSAAGNPVEGEPEQDDPAARSEAQLARVERAMAEAIKEHAAAKGRGSVPEGLARWAEVAMQPAKVRWQDKLMHAVRNACAYRSGAQAYRFDGPSRRQAGVGYGAGRPVMPRLRTPQARVAVVIDTSGSMGTKELTDALREVRGVMQAVRAEVEFCVCDAQVHAMQTVRTIEEALPLLKGGGGTDFRPAFTALEQCRPQPEIIVFITDGCGRAPECEPAWAHTIWTLLGAYTAVPCTWGEVVKVEGENK